MSETFRVPSFSSEAEEAQWWFDQQDELTKAFEAAALKGELKTGSAIQLLRREDPEKGR